MVWLWIACSSNEMNINDLSAAEMDSGFYTDTGMAEENLGEADDVAPEIVPQRKRCR